MTTQAILTLALAVMALAIKPGPGMMMVMSRSISGGLTACLTFVLGICLVSLLFLGLVLFGYKFFDGVDLVFISIVVKAFAATYLIWLGVNGLRKAQEPFFIEDLKVESFGENLSASIALTLSNPLAIVFYAGVLPTVLDVNSITTSSMFIVALVIVVVETVVAVGYSLPLIFCRHKMSKKFFRGLKYFSSIIIVLVGIYIGYSALPSKDITSVF